jgi:DNA-binding transcriptional regulator GbsR (MarR family)
LKHHLEKPIQAPLEDLPLFKKVSGVKETSVLAYRELIESGKHGTQVAQIYAVLEDSKPMTLREIQQATGLDINAVSGRVNDMKHKGLVVGAQKRNCRVTGRYVTPVGIL